MSTIPVEKFEAFENYNFDNDEQFQTGLKSLAYNEQENNAELLQRAKLFYYTK
ncbi:hypothetical protein BDF20DRAFT_847246 [Mycotypha africana]|uniref:uncharacterized protein n=1 Tax=Mycotypha africana TaxID=64632 RepID=UPI00230093C3|nr:uncharacterized protein BDF20DRAFT_847246 [Mycotypha africana]KAI8991917.1 hypothetical protein BDF20DRAFT_847246 [Mycotypha africana]